LKRSNMAAERTVCKLRLQVPYALRAPAAPHLYVRHHYQTVFRSTTLILATVLVSACNNGGGYHVSTQAEASAPVPGTQRSPELVLPLEVDLKLAETFVRIGYGLEKGFQSADFLTPRLRTAQAVPLIKMVKQYNDFDGERVAAAVQNLRGKVSGVEFGRDGSPVLFIELPYWTHQREETTAEGMGLKIDDKDIEQFVAQLRKVFVTDLKASEFSVRGRRVRVWWS
jgi:hypothetical protein